MHAGGLLASGDIGCAHVAQLGGNGLVDPLDLVLVANLEGLYLGKLDAPLPQTKTQMAAAGDLAAVAAGAVLVVEQQRVLRHIGLLSIRQRRLVLRIMVECGNVLARPVNVGCIADESHMRQRLREFRQIGGLDAVFQTVGRVDGAAHVVVDGPKTQWRAKSVRKELVDVRLPIAVQVGLVGVLLGEPPTVGCHDDAFLDVRLDMRLHIALAEHVLDGHPAAVGNAMLFGCLGIDLAPCRGVDLAQ